MNHHCTLMMLVIGTGWAAPGCAQQAAGDVLARSSACAVTKRDMQDILTMDGAVL